MSGDVFSVTIEAKPFTVFTAKHGSKRESYASFEKYMFISHGEPEKNTSKISGLAKMPIKWLPGVQGPFPSLPRFQVQMLTSRTS